MKWKFDFFETLILIVVMVWAVSSVIDVARGTAHADGCNCITHVEHPAALDAGAK